ncbi:MAG: bifunctional precorrin-2 dehydrogenase/sirohydrochlorin ferrochelatase [Sulfurimonas sp.]|uniref:precorrin-2 dehydrogenase/sirohydrochlorin ferrochelatase family protein n=1 Tax=Sulfurimonas sp. TaxID=2022749 RepID=UPI0025FFB8A8|nr:bifunctional precorrin-2 dehydrogenase/sirohydrochlorin ferrochelatase [Sulfurimonas sp.]MCK9490653.1 bifunctional precorrin-2 dehydrogenase/sirohydrochlorin ferrochelatase [Sulfurimonas sp.]
MPYFPAFLNLHAKQILIIGGGVVAHNKLVQLLGFTENIHIIAQEFCDDMFKVMEQKTLLYQQRAYRVGDIKEYDIVIIAIDDLTLAKEIYEESKEYKCLCNSVDNLENCDFTFASYIKQGDLTLAISTNGASPAFTKQLKIYLESVIPKDVGEFLKEMKEFRATLPKGNERMKMLKDKAKNYIKSWRIK